MCLPMWPHQLYQWHPIEPKYDQGIEQIVMCGLRELNMTAYLGINLT